MRSALWGLLVPCLALGCSANVGEEAPNVGHVASELVDPGTPYVELLLLGKLNSLGKGYYKYPAGDLKDESALQVHNGEASSFDTLKFAPTADLDIHQQVLIGTATDHFVAPGFKAEWEHMREIATAHTKRVQPSTMDRVFAALEAFGALGNYNPGSAVVVPHGLAYTPLRARWMRTHATRKATYNYPGPYLFRDMRQRGARLYCSAKRAREVQPERGSLMGSQALTQLEIFGETIRLFVVEARANLSNPVKPESADADGAQAFVVPLLLGTRFTPIEGVLPGMAEVQMPVALVSGESELVTPVQVGGNLFARDEYQTLTHGDAILSAEATVAPSLHTALFFIGPIVVSLDLDLSYRAGVQEVDPSRGLARALVANKFPSYVERTGFLQHNDAGSIFYHDGAWNLRELPAPVVTTLPAPAPPIGWVIEPDQQWFVPLALTESQHTILRPLQADDHAVSYRTSLSITAGLQAKFFGDVSFDPFEVTLKGTSSITGSVGQRFTLRDGLTAQGLSAQTGLPTTSVSIEPNTDASLDFNGLDVVFGLKLDLGFLDPIELGFTLTVANAANLAAYDTRDTGTWPESARMRLGTGGTGKAMIKPAVASHLPQQADHAPFETKTVAECLSEAPLERDDPEPCEGSLVGNGPPKRELCAYFGLPETLDKMGLNYPAPSTPPPNVCSDIDGYVAGLPQDEADCIRQGFELVCPPVSQYQSWGPGPVVARVAPWSSQDFRDLFVDALKTCAKAFVPMNAPQLAKPFLETTFGVAACTDQADLIAPDDIFSGSGNPSQPPPVSTVSDCQ